MGKTVSRLFDQFQPSHYDLALELYPETMTFKGSMVLTGKKTGRPSQRITLHQKGLKITEAHIRRSDKKNPKAYETARVNNQDSLDEVRIHTDEMLYPGEYTLLVHFESKITDGMTGIYPCNFKHDGTDKQLFMTQFESHHAREAFPCIDEPEAKATFSLVLNTPNEGVALSNMPALSENVRDGRRVTEFAITPRMSTYLLAFVVGELHSKSTKTKRGTDVAVWGTVAQPANSFDFSLNIAKQSIEFFEDYFGVDYPLPKADHVACPDFSSGAMENWGLITYRERALLVYPGDTAQSVQEYIATVVAHETSHQWFGNLVTMKWWDDLWLNESFADIMEYEAPDRMHPEWHVWDTFVTNEGLSALRRDATPGVQSVRVEVKHPDEISTLFDPSIVYAKGGRLLNMMKQYIGEPAFRKGLSAYFEQHKYGNTTGDDLWAALSEASGKDVGAFMNPWLRQSGFPVITVSQTDSELTLSQQHFLDNPAKIDVDRLWPVPLFDGTTELPALLDSRTITTDVKDNDIVLINRGAHGHYIVNYTQPAQQAELREQISSKQLSNGERLMALNDASMLARAGLRAYGTVLELLQAYAQEDSEPVWDMISLIIAEARRFVNLDDGLEDKIKAFIRSLVAAELARLGWEPKSDESLADGKLRATIISLAAYADEPSVIEQAKKLFAAYQQDASAVNAELRSLVFGVPVKLGDAKAIDYLLDLHRSTSNSDLQADICGALTATRNPKTADMLLQRITDASLVKPQDADRWLIYLLRSRYCGDVAWEWMVENWGWIVETYSNDKSYDMLPRYAAMACNTAAQGTRYREFFEPKMTEVPLKRNIEIGLEEITSRAAWLQRDLSSVQQFFN
ncbi:MAG TPA: M1 family metallopeptidase [Candidatus Microsaccharimonas sp.]|nr:M1 family metallopeptidase [Candidatus Microsaccharimonas sp.]